MFSKPLLLLLLPTRPLSSLSLSAPCIIALQVQHVILQSRKRFLTDLDFRLPNVTLFVPNTSQTACW
jgi:hypothetical protein